MPVVERDKDYDDDEDVKETRAEREVRREKEQAKAKRSKEKNRNTRTDHEKGEEAPADAFSHYLTLADGKTVRFNVGDKPNDPLPTSFGGVPVASVNHAIPAGYVEDEEDE